MAKQIDVRYIRLYTDGSAARKMEVAVPVQQARLPRAKKQKKIVLYIDPVAVLGIVTAVVMLIVMAISSHNFIRAQQKVAVMESYVQELRQENVALRETYEAGYDLQEVERTARALGMIPSQQARHVTVQVEVPQTQVQPNVLEQFYAFLTGLFA